jgi:hypothetical protein
VAHSQPKWLTDSSGPWLSRALREPLPRGPTATDEPLEPPDATIKNLLLPRLLPDVQLCKGGGAMSLLAASGLLRLLPLLVPVPKPLPPAHLRGLGLAGGS